MSILSPPSSALDAKLESDSTATIPTPNQESALKEEARAPSEKSSASTTESGFNPGWRFYLAFSSLSVITLMAALDATSISVALPIMAKVLKGTAIEAFWSGTSFLLTSTVFQPVLGSFSHIFGRKPLVFFSLALFTAGAIIAALAHDFTVILVGRSIQGIGGGGIICLTEIIVTDMVPLRERGKWFSFISSMWAIGTVTGPLLGGGFAQNVSWRWIFWINMPFVGIGVTMIILFLHLNYKTSSFLSKLRRVDWLGTVLFLASTTGFLIPITWGGVMYPWSSWRTLVPLILCALGLLAFFIHQERFAAEPLIRTEVLKSRTAAATYFATVIHGVVLWSLLYYMPLYYEAVKGFSPILAGVALFPQTFTVAPAAIVVGATIAITGRYRWAIWAGWALTTLGMGVLVDLKVATSTVQWIFMNLVAGLGTGILFPSMAIAVQASATSANQAYAASMFSFLRAFGQTLGVAVGGVIFQNQMKKKLLAFPLLADKAVEYSRDASGLVQIIKAMPAGEAKQQLLVSYTDALRYVWIVMCALSAVALAASLFTQAFPLDRALETEQGFKERERARDEEKDEA
ncbi:MFS general substrate transporter [Glonium stellatum]|uniref:MFS general substrate transporter n=1 Tax=Glonium stellatum TaxID=574774 RepID=A0A8E2F7Q9_9PEZI|nr:MFS general substrate transporter [Glonium stellatum]